MTVESRRSAAIELAILKSDSFHNPGEPDGVNAVPGLGDRAFSYVASEAKRSAISLRRRQADAVPEQWQRQEGHGKATEHRRGLDQHAFLSQLRS